MRNLLKSFKTLDKINSVNMPEHSFEFDTVDKIDSKFNQISESFNSQLNLTSNLSKLQETQMQHLIKKSFTSQKKMKVPSNSKQALSLLLNSNSKNNTNSFQKLSLEHTQRNNQSQQLYFSNKQKKQMKNVQQSSNVDFKQQDFKQQDHYQLSQQLQVSNKRVSESNIINYDIMVNSKQNSTARKNSSQINISHELEEKIKKQYKNLTVIQQSSKKKNPLVMLFGNSLIASVFQALVMKSCEELFNLQWNEDIPFSPSILKLFDISTISLNFMKSKQEKQSYILNKMAQTVNNLLTQFSDHYQVREKKQDDLCQKEDQKLKQEEEELKDKFDWLQIKTNYQALLKRLRISMIKTINFTKWEQIKENEERLKRLSTFDTNLINQNIKRQNSISIPSSPHQIQSPLQPGSLKRYSLQQSLHFLSSQALSIKAKLLNNASPLAKTRHFSANLSISNSSTQQISSIKHGKQQLSNAIQDLIQEDESFDGNEIDIQDLFLKNQQYIVDKNDQVLIKEWDQEMELDLKVWRKEAKRLFFTEVISPSWNNVALIHQAQKLIQERQKDQERKKLIQQYMEGMWMTAEELKFLAETSELLNKCLDKKFVQAQSNRFQKDLLHQLELDLSDGIIQDYGHMKELINHAREKFLIQQNQKTKIQIKSIEEKQNQKQKELQRKKQLKIFQKRMNSIVNGMEKQDRFRILQLDKIKSQQEYQIKAQKAYNKLVRLEELNQKIKNQQNLTQEYINIQKYKKEYERIKKEVADKSDEEIFLNQSEIVKNNIKRLNSQPLIKQIQDDRNQFVIKNKYHPPSKIFLQKLKQLHSMNVFSKKQQNLQKMKFEFGNLTIKSPEFLKSPIQFQKFYSNGPKIVINDNENEYLDEKFLRSVIKIQSIFKMKLAKKYYNHLKEQRQKLYYYIYFKFIITSTIWDSYKENLKRNKKIDHLQQKNQQLSNKCIVDGQYYPHLNIIFEQLNKYQSKSKNSNQKDFLFSQKRTKQQLQLKHQRLIEGAKKNNLSLIQGGGFMYLPDDMNIQDKNGNTALFYACQHGNYMLAQYLLQKGSIPNVICSNGNTPVHMAFQSNNIELIMLLISFNADLTVLNKDNLTPLALCKFSILKYLDLNEGIATQFPISNNKLNQKKPGLSMKQNQYQDVLKKLNNNQMLIREVKDDFENDNKRSQINFLQLKKSIGIKQKQAPATQKVEIKRTEQKNKQSWCKIAKQVQCFSERQ